MAARKVKTKRTPKKDCWQDPFLTELAETCNVRDACRIVGIGRQTVYDERKSNKDFARRWDVAIDEGVDALVLVARERAKGIEQDVFDKDGANTGTKVRYSDVLLMFLLKAHRPERFRDNMHITGDQTQRYVIELHEFGEGKEEKKDG